MSFMQGCFLNSLYSGYGVVGRAKQKERPNRPRCGDKNGEVLEKVQHMAAHEASRTTKLSDRTRYAVSLDEVERTGSEP
jgi:hypothetical protein